MIISIPMLPPKECNPNWRGHWATRYKATQSFRNAALICALAATKRGAKPLSKAEVSITLVVPDHRNVRDPDNALASLKPAIDGCVDAGVITGDDDEHLQYRLPILYKITRKEDRMTILEFKEYRKVKTKVIR